MVRHSLPALFAALMLAAAPHCASARDAVAPDALQQFSADQIAHASTIRATSSDERVVALARSMEAAHRRLQRHRALAAPTAVRAVAMSDLEYVEYVLAAHRAQLARCSTACGDDAEAVAAVLRSRIAMAQAMHDELAGSSRNFYTALESTD